MLQCFVLVAEEANAARAADRLGVAQSAVSRAVKKLEMELGYELLQRRRGLPGS